MAAHTPGPENVVILVGGTPVSNVNPLPTSGGGGGGGGVVDQGKQGSIAQPWFIQPTADGKTVSLPLPTSAATAAKQDTGNTSLSNIDGKVATERTLASVETLLGAGLPVALSGGRLDVNIGSTGVTQPISGTVTANVGTTGGLALDATLTGGTQRSKVTDGTNNAAVVNTAPSTEYGLVVRNIPSGTQPVSALSLPLPTGAATEAKQPALGTAGTPSADVISVQGVAGGTAQPVSPQARSATPAASFVNASASSVTLLAANASRKSASFFNNSNADLYLLETGGTADTTTGFTTVLRAAGGWHELPIGADGSITTGAITGIWASAGISGVAVCERV